jgi:hypothetical protein
VGVYNTRKRLKENVVAFLGRERANHAYHSATRQTSIAERRRLLGWAELLVIDAVADSDGPRWVETFMPDKIRAMRRCNPHNHG